MSSGCSSQNIFSASPLFHLMRNRSKPVSICQAGGFIMSFNIDLFFCYARVVSLDALVITVPGPLSDLGTTLLDLSDKLLVIFSILSSF